jgi:hypothetical protein
MVHSIELGGETRSILFGMGAFRKAKEKGLTLKMIVDALMASDFTIIADVTFYALQNAAAYEKKPVPAFDIDEVAMWFDVAPKQISVVTRYLMDAIESMAPAQETDTATQDGEAKKKKPK